MKVKPTNPANAAGLLDPVTRRSPFIDATDPAKPVVLETADVPENTFWTRRLLKGEIVRVDAPAVPAQPVGDKPAAKQS